MLVVERHTIGGMIDCHEDGKCIGWRHISDIKVASIENCLCYDWKGDCMLSIRLQLVRVLPEDDHQGTCQG